MFDHQQQVQCTATRERKKVKPFVSYDNDKESTSPKKKQKEQVLPPNTTRERKKVKPFVSYDNEEEEAPKKKRRTATEVGKLSCSVDMYHCILASRPPFVRAED